MPIALRDRVDLTADGVAAYLCLRNDADRRALRAALFLVNGRAEPLDFVFSRADLPAGVLWRPADARRKTTIALLRTLFTACPGRPDVLLARAEELPPQIFSDDLESDVTCVRLSTDNNPRPASSESAERLDDRLHAMWAGAAPDQASAARRLVDQLAGCGLLIEPFERAAAGMDEALGQ